MCQERVREPLAKMTEENFDNVALTKEGGRRGVTVNIVSPGFTDIDMLAGIPNVREMAVGSRSSPDPCSATGARTRRSLSQAEHVHHAA